MRLTKAEKLFLRMIEDGARVDNKTTDLAGCGRVLSTVVRNMGYTNENGYYNGEVPIPDDLKYRIKENFIAYNNKHKGKRKAYQKAAPDKSTDEYLIARLKYITDQLRERGYDVEEIKITYTI